VSQSAVSHSDAEFMADELQNCWLSRFPAAIRRLR
jgi:hypothetical protein